MKLTFSVPDLKFNFFIFNLDRFYLEIDSHGCDVRFDESVVDVSEKFKKIKFDEI